MVFCRSRSLLCQIFYVSVQFGKFRCFSILPRINSNFIVDSHNTIPPHKLGKKLLKIVAPSLMDSDKLYVSLIVDKKGDKKADKCLKLSFLYEFSTNEEKKLEEMFFIRQPDSNLSFTFNRMHLKFNDVVAPNRKKSKINPQSSHADLFPMEIFKIKSSSGEILNPNSVQNCDAFVTGNTFHIGERIYRIFANIPYFKKFKITSRLLVGFPLIPSVDIVDGSRDFSSFYWFVENDVTSSSNSQNNSDPSFTKTNDSSSMNVKGFTLKSTDVFYIPTVDDVDKRICVVCVPKNETCSGLPSVVCPSATVENLTEHEWIWSERHQLCADPASSDVLRIVDYNILADLYLELEEKKLNQKDLWFPYCPREYQQIDYRYPLLMAEISGYNADLLCLQEVETRFWNRTEVFFKRHGFGSIHAKKAYDVNEGAAIIYRQNKLRLVESTAVPVANFVKDNEAGFEDLAAICKQNEDTEKLFVERATVLQVALFQPLFAEKVLFVVCNTHLHFHPKHAHIRILQISLCLRYVEKYVADVKQKHPSCKVGVIFCGDFNTTPVEAVYRTMRTGRLSSDDKDWQSGSTETTTFKGIDFQTALQFSSACCPLKYTTFTGPQGFIGCLDYIFITDDIFEVSRRFPMPRHELVEKYTGLPSKIAPSDHLPTMCELKLR